MSEDEKLKIATSIQSKIIKDAKDHLGLTLNSSFISGLLSGAMAALEYMDELNDKSN